MFTAVVVHEKGKKGEEENLEDLRLLSHAIPWPDHDCGNALTQPRVQIPIAKRVVSAVVIHQISQCLQSSRMNDLLMLSRTYVRRPNAIVVDTRQRHNVKISHFKRDSGCEKSGVTPGGGDRAGIAVGAVDIAAQVLKVGRLY